MSGVGWLVGGWQIWYSNVPHPGLVSYKKDQNWVRQQDDKLVFPGGGTQFKHGAGRYIDFISNVRLGRRGGGWGWVVGGGSPVVEWK